MDLFVWIRLWPIIKAAVVGRFELRMMNLGTVFRCVVIELKFGCQRNQSIVDSILKFFVIDRQIAHHIQNLSHMTIIHRGLRQPFSYIFADLLMLFEL